MSVSKRARFEVMRRDNYTCRYCRSDEGAMTIDHVTPVALGGSDAPDNLVACCKDCNAGKSSASPDAQTVANVSTEAEEWAAAVKEAAADRAKKRRAATSYVKSVVGRWDAYKVTSTGDAIPKKNDWENTLRGFYAAGLSKSDAEDAVNITMSKPYVEHHHRWRYFCGVANTMIREMNDDAAALYKAGR